MIRAESSIPVTCPVVTQPVSEEAGTKPRLSLHCLALASRHPAPRGQGRERLYLLAKWPMTQGTSPTNLRIYSQAPEQSVYWNEWQLKGRFPIIMLSFYPVPCNTHSIFIQFSLRPQVTKRTQLPSLQLRLVENQSRSLGLKWPGL